MNFAWFWADIFPLKQLVSSLASWCGAGGPVVPLLPLVLVRAILDQLEQLE